MNWVYIYSDVEYSMTLLYEYTLTLNLAQKQQGGQDLQHKSPSTGEYGGL